MPRNDRGIGGEGLEQGGPSLGNDYSRKDLSAGNAGDALTTPNTIGLGNDDTDKLDIDRESSRNLGGTEAAADDDDFEEEIIDEDLDEDDDDLVDLDEDDDDDDPLERGI